MSSFRLWTHLWQLKFAGHLCAYELMGGPFDGYKHVVSFLPDEPAEVIVLPINENVYRVLEGKQPGRKLPARHMAIYELQLKDGTWSYQYRATESARHMHLEGWVG